MKPFVDSVIDKNSRACLIEIIPVQLIIKGYKKELNINVNRYFKNISEVGVYECEKTNYRFYYPFTIDGDSSFYEALQQYDWYYSSWKWEHEATKKLLSGKEKILEIGSGGLGFLENMQLSGFDVTGLELNKDSIKKGSKLKLRVLDETIQFHSINNFEKYDVVCSFQVLEHISDVDSFMKAQINCLKKGGKLIISVPNNDSFIKLSEEFFLNKPPHHMGLWNKKSLSSLALLFNITVEKIMYEPLSKYHLDWYINIVTQNKIHKFKFIKWVFIKLRLIKVFRYFIQRFRTKIKGHSILLVYTKISG